MWLITVLFFALFFLLFKNKRHKIVYEFEWKKYGTDDMKDYGNRLHLEYWNEPPKKEKKKIIRVETEEEKQEKEKILKVLAPLFQSINLGLQRRESMQQEKE